MFVWWWLGLCLLLIAGGWVLIIGLVNSVGVVCDCLLIGWAYGWLLWVSCLFAVVCDWLLLGLIIVV